MFTGIIEAVAPVLEVDSGILRIARPATFDDIVVGSSICVAGVCLSVVEIQEDAMTFHVVPETQRLSKLGELQSGDTVNLERALLVTDRFEGHVVQGHCEGVAEVVAVTESPSEVTVALPEPCVRHVAPKGSIALDGVSLTVATLVGDRVMVVLIPLTLRETTLGSLRPGDHVHIETDVLVRHAFAHPVSL